MPSATVLTIFVKPICLIFWALQRAKVPLFCFNVRASERSRIHRLLQRGQKCSCNHDRDHDIRRRGHQLRQICHKCRNQRIAFLHPFVVAIHMGRPENTERSVHCVQRRPSVLDSYCFLIITHIYFIINCASSTTHFTYRTKYIQFFMYSIQ